MSKEEILSQMVLYFEDELTSTTRVIKNKNSLLNPNDAINASIKFCLGVAQFSQYLGLDYEIVNPIYEIYKKRFEKLRG